MRQEGPVARDDFIFENDYRVGKKMICQSPRLNYLQYKEAVPYHITPLKLEEQSLHY